MGAIAQGADITRPREKQPTSRATLRARARMWDRIATGALWGLAGAIVLLLIAIILYMLVRGASVVNWNFITKATINSSTDGPEVFNTFYIIFLALIICVPFSLCAAIYLVEYAKQNAFTSIVRFATETLAGVPSLLIGFFAFLVFVTNFGHGTRFGYSRLAGALALVILNLPVLLSVFQDALQKVPNELREASAALGATKVQTVTRVLLPTAFTSLITGVILTIGKMIGETAALIVTAGASSSINGWLSLDPLVAGDTLTIKLYTLFAEGTVPNASEIMAGTATLLILLLLVFNLGFRWLATLINRRIAGSVR